MRALFASALLAALCLSCAAPAPGGEPDLAAGDQALSPRGGGRTLPVASPDPGAPSLHAGPEVTVAEPPLDLEALQRPPCEAPAGYAAVDLPVLLGDPQPWDGALVVTEGPVAPQVICTATVCPPTATCCRRCFVSHTMNGPEGAGNGVDDHLALSLPVPACVNSCDCAEPLGPLGDALVWGTFHRYGDSVALEADGYCER